MLTKYFTAKIKIPPEKSQRQRAYIEALETLDQIEIFYGKYQSNKVECNKCGNIMLKSNEKMTDVNIAVEMLNDAFFNRFETAILVSADSDLSAPVKTIKKNFPNKRIVCAFPPKRFYYELSVISDAHFIIGRKKFKDSLFPDEVEKPDGFKLKKPITWI
ncbi:MAG: NYN domain-containing protein [Bacteroidota bacterium]|nr:NYN domain-containing protein [Bacteroidota bacterium]